jgi:hypothetical protein
MECKHCKRAVKPRYLWNMVCYVCARAILGLR